MADSAGFSGLSDAFSGYLPGAVLIRIPLGGNLIYVVLVTAETADFESAELSWFLSLDAFRNTHLMYLIYTLFA